MGLLSRFFGGGVQVVDAETARRMLQQGAQLVDVRRKAELRTGKAAGAQHIPLHLLHHQTKKLDAGKPVLCICASGARSQAAAKHLLGEGFTEVYSVRGGMGAWRRGGHPIEA